MRIKAKYAKIIRQGLTLARDHSELMTVMTRGGLPHEAIQLGIRVIGQSMPQHPLALRAYVHEVEGQYKDVQRQMGDLKTRISAVQGKSPFIGKPPAPAPRKHTAPKIADGFHD